jgi:TPR repeat protein
MSSPETFVQRNARRRGRKSKTRRAISIVALTFCISLVGLPAKAERRVALVIGNAAYQNVEALRTPTNDADRVSALLRTLDFSVIELTDADKIAMEQGLRRFSADINGADVALFYYSGHGVQIGDLNYLVPVSAKVNSERSLPLDTIALQDISSSMRQAGAKVQLLFLDACRNNPFATAFAPPTAGAARGFAPVNTSTGSLIVFSTAPGQVARDGAGDVSPFTGGFLQYAGVPNLDVRQVLSRVRSYVASATGDQQVPWDNSSLLGDFFLVPKRKPPTFEKLAQVEVPSAAGPQGMRLAAPLQPEGGAINVKIEKAPAHGRLLLGTRQIGDDETVSSADFARLAYEGASSQAADSFSFRVNDAWGNTDVGLVSISRSATPALAVASIVPRHDETSWNVRGSAVSLVGLGPNLIFRKPLSLPADETDRRVQLAMDLPLGQIALGERVIEKGRSLSLNDLTHLTFAAPAGSEGRHLEARFATTDGPNSEIKIGIDLELTDCDRLAGDRLDAQGVAKGLLSSQIDTAAALPACETALKALPNSGRFNYEIGRVYAALGRDVDAVAEFKKAASLGYVRAEWALGYHDVYVPPVDQARGKEILERAAAAGDAYAIHTLGQIYYEGRGVPKDLEKAKSLFDTAARMGHSFSMNSLGRMYQRGETVPVDPNLARRYWEESAARGDIYGIDNLGFVYLEGIGAQKDTAKALSYFKQASDLGHPEAPNNIGRLYVLGEGGPVNYPEARKWYMIGADRGDAWAAYNLGELYRLGKGGPVDPVQAGYFYARAAALINRVEPAELARKELANLDVAQKQRVLRLLLRDLGVASDATVDAALADLAKRAMGEKSQTSADGTVDSLLIGTAQAIWLSKSARADLF